MEAKDTGRSESDNTESKLCSFRSGDNEESQVLNPDNPLLEKFQKALKDHLERQINHLKDDIYEYEGGVKKNNAKREELSLLVYDQQQILDKQQKSLDQYIGKLQTTTAALEEIENVLVEKKETFKQKRTEQYEAESQELQLRSDIEGSHFLIQQMSQWEDNLESDITVKKRVYEKTRKDKLKLLEDKRFQDALIYKLMMRIWFLEQELKRIDVQMKVKEEEREELAQTAALGNMNLDAMAAEYRCLMHSWNSVVVAVGNRDKVLACLNKELTKNTEHFKSILSENEQVKKLSQKEMRRNEEITVLRDRFMHDVQTTKMGIDVELTKKDKLEKKMMEMEGIVEQTEADIRNLVEETQDSNNLLEATRREQVMLNQMRSEIEEKVMKELEDQVSNNKTAISLQRILKLLRTKNRELETSVASGENKIANFSCDIQMQKLANFESQQDLNELEEQHRELSKEADKYQEEMRHLEMRIAKRQREVDMLNSKLQKTADKSGMTFASPLEAKINTFEKNIEELQEQNKMLQQFWLREQGNLLRISEERQEQIQNNNLIRKQILILEQKNLRVSDELDALKKQQDKVVRCINNLHSQLTVMGDNLVKTRGLKIHMDKDNEVLRQDYVYKLKDAELECLQLEDEIEQLEEDKISMSKELVDINRIALEWEKKFLSAKETKTTIIEERGQDGEVGNMKAEIHRMNVRFGQLKKVQDVLVQDLEHCVSRRDAIMTASEAHEKRTKGGTEKIRMNFNRKLDDIRNKTKQMQNQIEDMLKKMHKYEKEKEEIEEEVKAMEYEIAMIESNHKDMEESIEETITQRQMNFELLLQVQKKLNTYTDISRARKPHIVYRTENALATAYSKERNINSKLVKIVENLQGDFPNHIHEFNRLSNTLKIPMYVYFQ